MSPASRRVLQALLYEAIAIAVVGPVLSLAFDKSPASTFGLAVVLSCIALSWNYVFNWLLSVGSRASPCVAAPLPGGWPMGPVLRAAW